jgi:hypothetical protein
MVAWPVSLISLERGFSIIDFALTLDFCHMLVDRLGDPLHF